MVKKAGFIPISLDTMIAVVITLASLAAALTSWRTNVVNSQASGTNREGLIDAIKIAAIKGENWRKVYQEAGSARDYLIELAAVEALESSTNNLNTLTATNMREFYLPGLASLAEPMGTISGYRMADSTLDTQKRFSELSAQDPDLNALDPSAAFEKAGRFQQEQRFLTVGVILLAASLFWLGMAEISPGRTKILALIMGLGIFLGSLGYLAIVEFVFVALQGGSL